MDSYVCYKDQIMNLRVNAAALRFILEKGRPWRVRSRCSVVSLVAAQHSRILPASNMQRQSLPFARFAGLRPNHLILHPSLATCLNHAILI